MTKLAVAFAFLALNFYIYNFFAKQAIVPERTEFAEFPMELEGGWTCRPEVMGEKVKENLGVTDYLLCNYYQAEKNHHAAVYVGYHETQVREDGGGTKENSIHPPAHCLPGSGWNIIRNETIALAMPGLPGERPQVKRLITAKGEHRQLVYYWYQSRGRVIAEDWKKILYVGLDRARRGRTDGSLVRFSFPIFREDEAGAEASFRSLAPQLLKRLPEYVPN